MLKSITLILFIQAILLNSCTKEGIGGKASVSGHVKHHDDNIPGAVVYIKYGAEEFPGADLSYYDESMRASASDGHFEFDELRKGHYYLYAVGYDSAIAETVRGGIGIRLTKKDEDMDVDIPVTE